MKKFYFKRRDLGFLDKLTKFMKMFDLFTSPSLKKNNLKRIYIELFQLKDKNSFW